MEIVEAIFYKTSSFLIFFIGIIGNIICFLIYSLKKFRKISASFYFKSISINNSFILLGRLRYFIEVTIHSSIKEASIIFCKLTNYMMYTSISIAAWITVFVLFERFISIKFHRKFKFRNSQKFKWFILISINLISYCIYIPFYIYSKLYFNFLNTNITICYFDDEEIQILSELHLFYSAVVPFALMVIFTFLVIYILYESGKRLLTSRILDNDKKRRRKDIQFGLTSVLLNSTFLLNNFPILLLESFHVKMSFFVHYLIQSLVFLNCTVNIFIHIFSNQIFRSELFKIIRKILNFKRL